NIVLIISDDHGWSDYGFMNHPHIRTPRLDRLASQSIVYPRGYVVAPLCCPSLASILTGNFVHQHGVICNDPPGWPADKSGRDQLCKMIEAQPALPRLLAQRNYLSFQAGKWWLGNFKNGGFSDGMTHGDPTKGGRHGDIGLQIGRQTMDPVFNFMRTAKSASRPFFLWYAPMMPHAPHNPPARLLDKYRDKTDSLPIAKYWAMVEWFDESCGQLLDFLDQQNLADNTLLLYTADNGVAYTNDGKEYRSKREPYEKGIRTPIMVRYPGHAQPRRSQTPVSSIDLYTTALAAAGIDKPKGAPGVNLLDEAAVNARGPVFGSAFLHTALRLDDPAANLQCRYIIDGRWKLIAWFDAKQNRTVRQELFDAVEDLDEQHDLAQDQPQRTAQLLVRLDQWWTPLMQRSP
ncbi:MAG TPA: sulfatase-like hydrolase/transferase, partial [Tepidisphaeraceae bacterium]|nr:sulfatase-like hydrolase/transferase [Tepidisphaeraceae bacterium]